ncbi:MAG: hypothetical protein ABR907_14750 [Terracidiphilus sp.]
MRQTRGELAKRHQFIALRLDPRGLADAVGHDGNQPLAEQRHALEHLGKEASVQVSDMSGKHCTASAAVVGQPRIRKQTGHLPREPSENHLIGAISPLYANFSFEDDDEIVQRFTLSAYNFSRLKVLLLKMFREPVKMLLGQIREDLNYAQVVD